MFRLLNEEHEELSREDTLRDTADQTAIDTAKNHGKKEGIMALLDIYETALEEAE